MKVFLLSYNFAIFLSLSMVLCSNSENELVIGEVKSSQAKTKLFDSTEQPTQVPSHVSNAEKHTLTPTIITLEKIITKINEKPLISDRDETKKSINEISECDEKLNRELICLFEGLSHELSKVTKFYYYFDVLSYIDKSIALIYEILITPESNVDKNLMVFERKSSEIDFDFETVNKELSDFKKKDEEENISDLSGIENEDEIATIGTYARCLKKKYGHYEFEKIQKDYSHKNTMKSQELKKLQSYLKDMKAKIFPMKEEDIEKHVNLFKGEFLTAVVGVYNNLINCLQKENESLDWIFKILNDIYKGLGKCIEELKLHETTKDAKTSFQE